MNSHGENQAALMPDKSGPAPGSQERYSQYPGPPPAYTYPQQYQPAPMMYPQGQPQGQPQQGIPPQGHMVAPQVQYIIQNPQPLANPPADYFIHAVLVTVFCFWPTGIIAIIKALNARRAIQTGDANNAQLSSQDARNMYHISLFIGLGVYVLLAIVLAIEFVVIFSF
uniref:uncharacterized protein n=1 Tax=Asterias amurensis TaxID=7602 RepID=UPI003AB4782B